MARRIAEHAGQIITTMTTCSPALVALSERRRFWYRRYLRFMSSEAALRKALADEDPVKAVAHE